MAGGGSGSGSGGGGGGSKLCWHFQIGKCRFGDACRSSHAIGSAVGGGNDSGEGGGGSSGGGEVVVDTICSCEHADCANAPPSFTTIRDLEDHHTKEHSAAAGENETMAAIFKPTEDALTPAWRKKDADSFEHSRIRWEQAAHIAKAIIPVCH